jgi:hypothetical protein
MMNIELFISIILCQVNSKYILYFITFNDIIYDNKVFKNSSSIQYVIKII